MSKGIIKTSGDMIPAPTSTITTSPLATPAYPISMLINSVYFFIHYVFIIIGDNTYRLVVIHENKVLYDNQYKTLRGARIAFYRLFKHKAWGQTHAHWSFLYNPDEDWMDELMNILTGKDKNG